MKTPRCLVSRCLRLARTSRAAGRSKRRVVAHCIVAAVASAAWCAGAAAATLVVSLEPVSTGSEARQFRTIQQAVDAAQPGDTVQILAGLYRECVTVRRGGTAEAPVRIEAADGATVVLTGADRLQAWKSEERGVFSHEWRHVFINHSRQNTHPDDPEHRLVGRAEQVIDRGYLLRQVLDRSHVAPGTFFADLSGKRLYAMPIDGADYLDANVSVEASTRAEVLIIEADHVCVRGLTIRHAANAAQQGAAQLRGKAIEVEACVVERTNGVAATVTGEAVRLRGCTFRDNGQMGLGGARCHGLKLLDCLISGNNTKGFERGWEAGGMKLVLCRGVEVAGCKVVDNRGVGLWFDIGAEDVTVRNCLLADNEAAGLFYEISYGLHAHDNLAVGNGLAHNPSSWGSQAGIAISSSQGCKVERNILIGNREGLAFREQQRTTPRIDQEKEAPIRVKDVAVTANLIACNVDGQVRGWFDVDDKRHLPPLLAQMGLTFRDNRYVVQGSQAFWAWGASWRNPKTYATPEQVLADLGLDAGAAIVAAAPFQVCGPQRYRLTRLPPFGDVLPRGDVPGLTVASPDAK